MQAEDTVRQAARWVGFIGAIGTVVVGVVHLCNSTARITWPDDSFISDVNLVSWRRSIFTLQLDAFADAWSPMMLGLPGIAVHLRHFELTLISKTFLRYFVFLFFMGLFACMGYAGGLGILISAVVLLGALLSLISYFLNSQIPVSLGFKISNK